MHEASVYAVPDERLGEEVGATLYTDRQLSDHELTSFLSERLAKFKIPTYVWQQQQPLPRTASGKILKRELREQILSIPARHWATSAGSGTAAERQIITRRIWFGVLGDGPKSTHAEN